MQDTRLIFREKFVILLRFLCVGMLTIYSQAILAESDVMPNILKQNEFVLLSAPDSVKNFLNDHIKRPEQPFANDMAQNAFLRRTKHEINELLATQGYFSPVVTFDKKTRKKSEIPVIVVDPGPLTHIVSVRIEFQGSIVDNAAQQSDIKKWRKAWPLKAGKPFRSAEWEEAKAVLLSQVAYEKYAAASIVKSEAIVDKQDAQVALHIVIDSGPVFYFGELEIAGLERYDPEMIENYMPFRPGEPYSKALMHRFQIALQNIPHFGNVSVNIDSDVSKHEATCVSGRGA